jgi:hypothetical protein
VDCEAVALSGQRMRRYLAKAAGNCGRMRDVQDLRNVVDRPE